MSITTELQLIIEEFAIQLDLFSADMSIYIAFIIGAMAVILIIALLTGLAKIIREAGGL